MPNMRLPLIIILTLFLWSGSISIHFKPETKIPSHSRNTTCQDSTNGDALLQAMHKGTIVGIHDNGNVLHIGIPGNWAAFPLEAQKSTIHHIQCYAKSLNRRLQYTHIPIAAIWPENPYAE